MNSSDRPPIALSVVGTDPSGGAGLAADLRTYAAHRVHGTFAVTVVTVQGTTGIRRAERLEPELVAGQIEAVVADLPPDAVKLGLLLSVEVVRTAAEVLPEAPLVVDPVLADRHGRALTGPEVVEAYRRLLLPRAEVVTPNAAEATLLSGVEVTDETSAIAAARSIAALGPRAVVVTGGRLGTTDAVDVVVVAGEAEIIRRPRLVTTNDHGSGCTFAAAATARLALGDEPLAAVWWAGDFVSRALAGAAAWDMGPGRGPLDQMGTEPS